MLQPSRRKLTDTERQKQDEEMRMISYQEGKSQTRGYLIRLDQSQN